MWIPHCGRRPEAVRLQSKQEARIGPLAGRSRAVRERGPVPIGCVRSLRKLANNQGNVGAGMRLLGEYWNVAP